MAKNKKPEQEILDVLKGGEPVNMQGEGVFMSLFKDESGFVATSKQARQPTRYADDISMERYIFTLLQRGYVVVKAND